MKRHSEPRPLQLSKRANVFYLEHARVVQQDDRIVYLTQDGGEFEQMFNIPERNTAFLLLGKGTSITDAAMRRMAASNVMVGFCGTGGSPLFSVCDIAFMTPQSEYRPTEYMQAWAEMWFDPARRMEKARCFLRRRAQMTAECWRENSYLQKLGIVLSDAILERFHSDLEQAKDVQELLLAEARWTNAARDLAQFSARFGTPLTCASIVLAHCMQRARRKISRLSAFRLSELHAYSRYHFWASCSGTSPYSPLSDSKSQIPLFNFFARPI